MRSGRDPDSKTRVESNRRHLMYTSGPHINRYAHRHSESRVLVHTSAQTYTYAMHTYIMQAKENVETENSIK